MNSLKEKIIYSGLAIIILITSIILFLQIRSSAPFFSEKNTFSDPSLVTEEATTPKESLLVESENQTRKMTGTIVMLGEDNSYIRLNVIDEGIFSVGITAETVITTKSGLPTSLQAIEPFAEAMVELVPLEDSQVYDFLAISVSVKGSDDLTPKEREEKMLERIKYFNN